MQATITVVAVEVAVDGATGHQAALMVLQAVSVDLQEEALADHPWVCKRGQHEKMVKIHINRDCGCKGKSLPLHPILIT